MPDLLREALERLTARRDLTQAEARALLTEVFALDNDTGADAASRHLQIAAILAALATKGETVDEIVGFAEAMRAAVVSIGLDGQTPNCVDTCGTGGGARHLFNVSTAAALAAAGAGVAVAKHGNRTSTGVCGSADILEAVGVNLNLPAGRLGPCLLATGIAFLYAPLLHFATRAVMPARRALKIRTVFNLLGPLTNPAGARAQVVGVPVAELAPKLAEALLALGTAHSFVVHSQDGLGEFSTTARNQVYEVRAGRVREFTLDARQLGLPPATIEQLSCHNATEAVAAFRAVLSGAPGPHHNMVCLNAAAALVAAGAVADFAEGITRARQALTSGAAQAKLEALVAYTRTHAQAEATRA